jgi:hypothetical protein
VARRIGADVNVPEFANVFALLAVQLRQTDADEALIRGYYEGLQDLELELLKAAAEWLSHGAVVPQNERMADLSVSNSLSGRDRELDKVPAVGDPTHMAQLGTGDRVSAGEG